MNDQPTKTYRLGSSEAVYAPNIVRFAINGAKFKKDRQKMVRLIAEGWHIPMGVALRLVRGKVPYTVEGETVVFEA